MRIERRRENTAAERDGSYLKAQTVSLKKRAGHKAAFRLNRSRLIGYFWAVVRAVLIIGLSFIILYPLIVKFSTSIKSYSDLSDPSVVFLPKHPTLRNYTLVFNSVDYPITFLYTVGFTLLNSVVQIASCTLVAYGLARFKFKGKKLISAMTILTLIVPPQAMLMPLYLRFRYFSLFNLFKFTGGLSGVSLVDTVLPFLLLSATAVAFKNGLYIYMLRQYFRNMPSALEEAAYIDGCGTPKTFYRIMLPGASSMILTMFLFCFVWQWNDKYYTQTLFPNMPTLANKLFGMVFSSLGNESAVMNTLLETSKFFLLIAPLIILYVFTQKYFTESIQKSGIVG